MWDVALAHIKAIEKIEEIFQDPKKDNFIAVNIGRGVGVTVKEFVACFEKVANVKLTVHEKEARPGDVLGAYAVCDLAKELLGWEASLTIEDAIRDAMRWEDKKKEIGF